MENSLQFKSLNHISLVCRSVEKSLDFYTNVLGFFPIRRPGSFKFDGAWLFNYGIGIHLLQSEDPDRMPKVGCINPKDNHISFQCESMETVEKKLKEMKLVRESQTRRRSNRC
ncbi:Lactoylglutathione lyase / glyoxalase I family protein [Quillaja saponaria]|uniref:Lactoylglutathione lyase / glyoxalase I family protein n=1 Tax=Quillaja saponaria TaxID=32244 RepID=A0AAD7VKI8_QUISA|nr:Lactoylglutathione lyase / glyoxalase I family protein [Quillaja saponaria]